MKGGVIATQSVKEAHVDEPLVEQIDRLSGARWWEKRSSSIRLDRNIAAYCEHLDPVLRCANSFQFIDPHLHPGRPQYREFANLLACAGGRMPAPLIEIHRVCYEGSGPGRRILENREIEHAFRSELSDSLRAARLSVDVFIWDDFHDRYLLTNLLGISLPNGFDTTNRPDDVTTWSRIGRTDRDDIQREFEEASGSHTLRGRFSL